MEKKNEWTENLLQSYADNVDELLGGYSEQQQEEYNLESKLRSMPRKRSSNALLTYQFFERAETILTKSTEEPEEESKK